MSLYQTESKPWQIQNAFDDNSGLTNSNTTFKDYLFMDEDPALKVDNDELYLSAYLYETNRSNLIDILPKIRHILSTTKYSDLLLSISFIQKNSVVMNIENLTEKSIKV